MYMYSMLSVDVSFFLDEVWESTEFSSVEFEKDEHYIRFLMKWRDYLGTPEGEQHKEEIIHDHTTLMYKWLLAHKNDEYWRKGIE